jgi:hypothetical protein
MHDDIQANPTDSMNVKLHEYTLKNNANQKVRQRPHPNGFSLYGSFLVKVNPLWFALPIPFDANHRAKD